MMPRLRFGRPGPGALGLVPAIAIAAIGVAAARVPILTPDVWWHLATGRVTATSGIPRTDPFSYTLGDRPWLVHEWLADRIAWAVYSNSGLLGLVWWRGAAIALAVALAYRLARRHAAMGVALPLWGLAAFALQRNVIDRPQLWTFVLLPLAVGLLETERTGRRRVAWLLPPLVALWVNVHGGFMIGLVTVILWQAAQVIERRGAGARRAAFLVAACAAAACLNPHGPAGAVYPLRYVGTGLRDTIQEEQPGDLDSPYAWVHLGLAAALLAASLGRGMPLAHRLLAWLLVAVSAPRIAGLALPFAAERHAPLLLLAGVPLLAWRLDAAIPAGWRRAGARVVQASRAAPALAAAAVLGGFAVWQLARAAPRDGAFEARVLPGRFPHAAAAWLEGARLPGNLVNPYRWGGYLAFALAPQYSVWIDSRGDLYGAERLREDEWLYRMPPGGEAEAARILDRWDANVIVWFMLTADFGGVRVHPFTRWLLAHPEWRLVFADLPARDRPDAPALTTAVFLREHPRNAAHLERLPRVRLPRLP